MVFSFFKKQPEKMITRPAAVPRQAAARESARPEGAEQSSEQDTKPPEAAQAKVEAAQAAAPSDFSDFALSQSSLDFHLEGDVDPVDAAGEEAAVLFANNQDVAARAVLEAALQFHRSGSAERLWLMLFDLYRLSGEQAAFEAVGMDYAQAFEKSPPTWSDKSADKVRAPDGVAGTVVFKGDLCGANVSAFETVRQSLEKNPRLRLDMSKVKEVDPAGCGCLLKLLANARKNRRQVELLGREAFSDLVRRGVEVGRAEGKECWLLLLELCQQQGRQEVFEDLAIEYAVTFEESPPSWDAMRVAAPEPVARVAQNGTGGPTNGAYALSGEVKSSRFGDLPAFAQEHDALVIDCAGLVRMDFISAGALLNVLTSVRSAGKQIVFRHPNRLVAELFRVIGLTAVATVVFAKN